MAAVETALVSSAGKLLVQLDDGTIIDAGYVKGQKGDPGKDGADGAQGIPGAKGDPGENGAKWHTGVGAPEASLGVSGDLYMDVAAAVLPIYQKINRDWLFLANLKQAPAGGGGGGGTAAGGGGAVIIHPGPQPPTVDNDGKPIQDGDLWVDINGNILYVYYDGVWSEVTACGAGTLDEKKFVKRSGDSMYGDLLFKAEEETDDADYLLAIRTNDTYNPKQRNFYGEYTEFKVENALYFGPKTDDTNFSFEVNATRRGNYTSHYLEVSNSELWSGTYASDGTLKSELKHRSDGAFKFRAEKSGGFYVDVLSGNSYDGIYFYSVTKTAIESDSGYELVMDNDKGLTYNATIEDTDDAKTVTNKEYVDTKDNILQQEIINLQEEIESITPTVQAGIWQDGNSATPGTGRFAMRLGNGSITQDYTDTTIVTLIVSTTDKDGGAHTFEKEEVGDEIQLFDVEDQHYGLFKIDAIDNSSPDYVQFTVTHLRGSGSTHVDDDVIIRTFKPVTGGDGSAYLLKHGETIIDAVADVNYEWNKPLTFETKEGAITFKTPSGQGVDALPGRHFAVKTDLTTSDETAAFYVSSKSSAVSYRSLFRVLANGKVQAGLDIDPFIATEDNDITTKKFVDDKFDFSQYQELS